MKKIAIIGATGKIGFPVTREFIHSNYEVTILSRDPSKAKKMFGQSVKIVEGDLENPGSLKQLLEGQHWLYINLSVAQTSKATEFQPEREGIANILKVAKEENIQRIGYLSSLVQRYHGMEGFSWWGLEIRQQAIHAIKNSDIPYSIFYPSNFMENFDEGDFIVGNRILLIGKSLYPYYWIAGSDYGKQVINAFEKDEGNTEYVIQGPEALSAEEAGKVFAHHYKGRKLSLLKIPFWILKVAGMFSSKANYGTNIIYALNHYPEKYEAAETWLKLGKPETTLSLYAANAS